MAYQLLKNRGALNEADIDPGVASSAQPISVLGRDVNLLEPIDPTLLELIPQSVARDNLVLPLAFDGERLTVAAANANDIALADKLRFILAKDILLVPAPRHAILEAINRHYGQTRTESVDSMLQELTDTSIDLE